MATTSSLDASKALVEQIKVMVGDKQSTIRSWVLRVPLEEESLVQGKRAGRIR